MVITEHRAVNTKSFLFDKSLFFSFTSIFLFFKCIFCFNFQIIFVLDIFIANNGYGLLLHYIFALQSRVTNLTLFIYSYGTIKLASIDMYGSSADALYWLWCLYTTFCFELCTSKFSKL